MKSTIALLLLFFLCVGVDVTAQSQQEKEIVKAFSKTVADYIPAHVAKRPVVVHPACGWNKQYYEPSTDYSIDVRKSDSLVSPYIGVVEFAVVHYISACHATQAEAEKDSTFPAHSNHTHRYTFAYQDDTWILKSRKVKFDTDTWYPCGPASDGCL